MVDETLSRMGKKEFSGSQIDFIKDHEIELQRWLDKHVDPESHRDVLERIKQRPFIAKLILQQEEQGRMDKIKSIARMMAEDRGRIDIVLGGKGSGKNAWTYYIAEKLEKWHNEDIWWYGPPAEVPDQWNSTMSFEEIPANTTTIIDEASVQFFSRGHDESGVIQKLPTVRHSGRNFLVLTQNTALIDINFIRLVDSIAWKSYEMFDDENERISISEDLEIFMPSNRDPPKGVLFYYDGGVYKFDHGLADMWNEKYSTPYRDFHSEGEKIRFILKLMDHFDEFVPIQQQVQHRNASLTEVEYKQIQDMRMRIGDDLLEMSDRELVDQLRECQSDIPVQAPYDHGSNVQASELEFHMDRVMREKFQKKREMDEKFKVYSQLNANHKLLEQIRDRLENNGNNIVSIFGPTGTSKSWSALALAYLNSLVWNDINESDKDPEDRIHVYWEIDNIRQDMNEGKFDAGDTIIRDEQPREHGEGSQRKDDDLENMEETLRAENINFIFVAPDLREHKHHFILETYGVDKDRGVSRLIMYTDKHDYMGYVTLMRAPPSVTDPYEERKKEFTSSVMSGDTGKNSHKERARDLLEKGDILMSAQKKSHLEAIIEEEYPQLTKGEINSIKDWIELLIVQENKYDHIKRECPAL